MEILVVEFYRNSRWNLRGKYLGEENWSTLVEILEKIQEMIKKTIIHNNIVFLIDYIQLLKI